MTHFKLYNFDKLSRTIFCCLWVSQTSVSSDQISTFSNIYRHKSPIRVNCWCWENWGMVEGRFSKWFWVLKQVFWTFSYLYLWHTMWFHAKKLLKTLKFWKLLNSLCKSGSRPQKSPKIAQKTDHSIAIYSNFWIGMVYFGYHLVKPHVQTVQNMYSKGE